MAVSHVLTMALTLRVSPLVAVADQVVVHLPEPIADRTKGFLGGLDKPVLMMVVGLVAAAIAAWVGGLARRGWWPPLPAQLLLGAAGIVLVLDRSAAAPDELAAGDVVPLVAGLITWVAVLSFLAEPLRRWSETEAPDPDRPGRHPETTRRDLLARGVGVGLLALAGGIFGERLGKTRRHVEESRRLLRLPVTDRRPPRGVRVDVDGVKPWRTTNRAFFRRHEVAVPPAIEPDDWQLQIHGLVDRDLVLGYQELVDRRIVEGWATLTCVTNEVGGSQIGNAWWSGVSLARLLRDSGIRPGADAVRQTSAEGWTCLTPLSAILDDRNAMLAIAMNGEPLPIGHGFPVRSIVPGVYGYVGSCKWVVDLEVTTMDAATSDWGERGWPEGLAAGVGSRIDVPEDGDDLRAGTVYAAGTAWKPGVGIESVEVAIDGGTWQPAELARAPGADSWVQWSLPLDVGPGEHRLRVRGIAADGEVQSGMPREPETGPRTGWHAIGFDAS